MANSFNIDQQAMYDGPFAFLEVAPKTDMDGVHREDRDGNPQYVVQVMVKERESGRREILKVTVASTDPKVVPGAGLQEMQPVVLRGLRVGAWVNGGGDRNWFYGADSVAAVGAQTPVAKAG